MATTLVVTNDFPPRIGGIENFVAAACRLLDDEVVVLTAEQAGSAAYDRRLDYPVTRMPGPLLPTPTVGRRAAELLDRYAVTRVLYGAAAPLGLLAGRLRAAGAAHQLALSHGHEVWWAQIPATRGLLRRIAEDVDHLGYISEYTGEHIAPVLSPAGRAAMVRLPPPVDLERFVPGERAERPTVIAAGRMVRQKGFDTLLQAWARLAAYRRSRPMRRRPQLLIAGDGPQRRSLVRQSRRLGLHDVHFLGPVPHHQMPGLLARGHVFALPVRTRLAGLNPEGLGLVFLEAAACGLAVVAGASGGAPETVLPGRTGAVVPPDDPARLATVLGTLLSEPDRAAAYGRAGREYAAERFGPDQARRTLRRALALE